MDKEVKELIEKLNGILLGKEKKIKKIVATFLVGGNILLEDMPGVGKTVIAKALAKLIASDEKGKPVKFSRIQATPDLLPYDITGVDIYDASKKKFVFNQGPIFTDILLADELNRTTPKVQSALLQAMAEKEVTVGQTTYSLSEIFLVIATQNPIETEGTYPLPAAQLDRFSISLQLGYPDIENEILILEKGKSEDRLNSFKPVITKKKIIEIRKKIQKIEISQKLRLAIASVCQGTRRYRDIRLGLSTRAGLMMSTMIKANAYLEGRDFGTDQDLLDLAKDVWGHRILLLNPQLNAKDMITKITHTEVKKILAD